MQTVIFVDIDSTIVENSFSFKVIDFLSQEIADAVHLPVGTIQREIWEENNQRQQSDPNNPLTMDWDDILLTIANRHGVTPSRTVIDLWLELADAADVAVLDNSPDVLHSLKAPHRKLVIASKGLSKYQYPLLDVVNMRRLFDDFLMPDITGYLKTQPEYFNSYTANGTENTRFIHVGDHFYDDVICARRNGFYSVLRAPIRELKPLDPFERPAKIHDYSGQIDTYPEGGTDVVPNAVVVSLVELPAVVERIEAE